MNGIVTVDATVCSYPQVAIAIFEQLPYTVMR